MCVRCRVFAGTQTHTHAHTRTPAENCICFCLERAWVSIISREMIRVDPACNQIVEQPAPALRYVWVTATHTQAAGLIKFHFDIINTHTHGHTHGADRAARSVLTFLDLSLSSLASLFPHACSRLSLLGPSAYTSADHNEWKQAAVLGKGCSHRIISLPFGPQIT